MKVCKSSKYKLAIAIFASWSTVNAEVDYSDLIQNKDVEISRSEVNFSNGTQSGYEINASTSSKESTYTKQINDVRDYLLLIEREAPGVNGSINRITEVKEDKVTIGEGVWHGLGGSYGDKYTTAITANFDSEGHLISRTFCHGSRNSSQLALQSKCRTITYNRCKKALELKQEMDVIEKLAGQCKDLERKLNDVYQNRADLDLIRENLNHLSDHSKVAGRKKPIEKQLPRLSEIDYRLPDLGYTIRLCEEHGRFFRNKAVHPASIESSEDSKNAE